LVRGHELRDLDGLGLWLLDGFELVRAEQDVLALGEFITLHDVFAGYDLVFLRADVLLLHTSATGLVHHVESNAGFGFGCRVKLYRQRNQPERDRRCSD